MAWQKPKKDHPWRQYQVWFDKKVAPKRTTEKKKRVRAVKAVMVEIIDNWDTITIYTTAFGRTDKYSLKELPQEKIAAWLCGLLRRAYAN